MLNRKFREKSILQNSHFFSVQLDAITKYHRRGDLKQRTFIFPVLKAGTFKMKVVLEDFVSGENLLPGWQMFALCSAVFPHGKESFLFLLYNSLF